MNDGFSVAAELSDPFVFKGSRAPGAKFGVFRLQETGNEFGVGSVAFIASELLMTEGFDLSGIDQKERVDLELVKSFGDVYPVVPGLLEAG